MTEVFKIIPAPSKTLWLLAFLALIMAAALCLMGYLAYSSRHVQFELSDTQLHITGDLYGRKIPRSSLVSEQAMQVELNRGSPYQTRWRTNGAGLPGYRSGWFRLKNGEKALLFVTDPENVIYVPTTEGYSVLMSVQDSERFLQLLKQGESE